MMKEVDLSGHLFLLFAAHAMGVPNIIIHPALCKNDDRIDVSFSGVSVEYALDHVLEMLDAERNYQRGVSYMKPKNMDTRGARNALHGGID